MSFVQQGFRFLGFGDACRIDTDRVFAMVHFRPANVPQAQMWLSVYREKHKIPANYPMNGTELGSVFSTYDDQGALRPAALTNYFMDLVSAMNRVPGLLRFAHHRLGLSAPADARPTAPIETKDLLRACYTVPNDGSQGPPAHETKIMIREGSTSAAPMVDKTGTMTVPIHAVSEAKEPLLEYAGVLACVSALSMTKKPEHQVYADAIRRLKHWSSVIVS